MLESRFRFFHVGSGSVLLLTGLVSCEIVLLNLNTILRRYVSKQQTADQHYTSDTILHNSHAGAVLCQ